MLHIGSHKNDVCFSVENEEEHESCWGICLVFPVTHIPNGGNYTISVLRDKKKKNTDDKVFDGVVFSSWIIDSVALFTSVYLKELAQNHPKKINEVFLLF